MDIPKVSALMENTTYMGVEAMGLFDLKYTFSHITSSHFENTLICHWRGVMHKILSLSQLGLSLNGDKAVAHVKSSKYLHMIEYILASTFCAFETFFQFVGMRFVRVSQIVLKFLGLCSRWKSQRLCRLFSCFSEGILNLRHQPDPLNMLIQRYSMSWLLRTSRRNINFLRMLVVTSTSMFLTFQNSKLGGVI